MDLRKLSSSGMVKIVNLAISFIVESCADLGA